MTQLQRRALARTPMPAEQVERIYAAYLPAVGQGLCRLICDLCESHERLRAELQGAEVMLDEADAFNRQQAEAHQRQQLAEAGDRRDWSECDRIEGATRVIEEDGEPD